MTGRIQLIEEKLSKIDSASFQKLCDVYLSIRENLSGNFHTPGSQLGKLKTTSGTPDTFYRLSSQSLAYVEYTTQYKGIVKKIKDDINKCLNEKITGVSKGKIGKIIICFNREINQKQESEIWEFAEMKHIQLELIGIKWLALEIVSKYLIIAKDFLNIPLDTGQVLMLKDFIFEYNNKAGKLSTPLDNLFLHRDAELSQIVSHLTANDLLIISGFPGVGKTKIALEAMTNFLTMHPSYTGYAIAKKDVDIFDDLKILLQKDKNYILLVDDANRQTANLLQLLGLFKEKRLGKLKIILTVRNYALADIQTLSTEYSYETVIISKFKDEELINILKSNSFNIQHSKYHNKIIELADGNARLAIMAAKVANDEQYLFLLKDVSDLYDSYFATLNKDLKIFSDLSVLKTLGLISFFFTINLKNREFLNELLNKFEIDYYAFNEAIQILHTNELIEVQFDHVRISEQVLATYFFYKVFLKDEYLSFKTLLGNYFQTNTKRFSESVIPANNAFGYEKVEKKVKPLLADYLVSISNDEQSSLKLFSTFWFYLGDEILSHFFKKVTLISEPLAAIYQTEIVREHSDWNKDPVLENLSHFFYHNTPFLITALELSFEYCRKSPEYLAELCKTVCTAFTFHIDDAGNDFARQKKLFDYLIKQVNEGQEHCIKSFFHIAPIMLQHEFQSSYGRKKNTIVIHRFILPVIETIKTFRLKIWSTLFDFYEKYEAEIFSALKKAIPNGNESVKDLLLYDLNILVPFWSKQYNPKNLKHAVFIQDLIFKLKRFDNVYTESLKSLQKQFESNIFKMYRQIDWNIRKGKAEFDCEYDQFKELKEKDIRKAFSSCDSRKFNSLLKLIHQIGRLENGHNTKQSDSLDIIIDEVFLHDDQLGFKYLLKVFQDYPTNIDPLGRVIQSVISKSESAANQLWIMLSSWKHHECLLWKLQFFYRLPERFITESYVDELILTVESVDTTCTVYVEELIKFQEKEPSVFKKILSVIVQYNDRNENKIFLWHSFFELFSDYFIDDIDLLLRAYIQQDRMNDLFDYNKSGLKKIVSFDAEYFVKYISAVYEDFGEDIDRHENLSFVWDLKDGEMIVKKSIEIMVSKKPFYGLDHPINVFFNNVKNESKPKIRLFIFYFIEINYKFSKKINAIFEVIRKKVKDLFEECLLHYLQFNTDLNAFEKVQWIGSGGVYSGHVNIGLLHAGEWQNILETVDKYPSQLSIFPIKDYIKRQVEYELKRGEQEKMQRFIEHDYD